MKKILGILVVVGIALGAYWYMKPGESVAPEEPVSTTGEEKKPALSFDAIKNMEIVSPLNDQRVKLREGSLYFKEVSKDETWEVSSAETDYFIKLYAGASPAYGDLDGDGVSETLFVLVSRSGGTGTFYDLAVVKNENDMPVWGDSEMLGDRISVKSVVVEDGKVVVDTLDHGPNEPLAVATMPRLRTFSFVNGALAEVDVD